MAVLKIVEKTLDWYFACLPRKKPHSKQIAEVQLIAHRGAHEQALKIIENTHAAFARAETLGCWGIELDVHATADEILVVNHDSSLQRIWDKDLMIADLSFAQLRQLVPDIPSLSEVIERYGKKMHLFIELKTPFRAEAALQKALQNLVPCEDYHLLSLDEPLFASFTLFDKKLMFLVPVHNNVARFCQLSLQKGYGGVLGHYVMLTNKKIKMLENAQQQVGVGQVNSVFGLYRELNRGLRWIFSNKVGLLSNRLKDLNNLN